MKKILLILISLLILSAVSCSSGSKTQIENSSPSEVLKTFIEAKKRKDAETVEKTISADSLKLYKDLARRENKPVGTLLTDNTDGTLQNIPPMRNEKIEGDTATVEVQSADTNVWAQVPFVKEEDGWKIALDKVIIDALKKGQETIQKQIDETSTPLPK